MACFRAGTADPWPVGSSGTPADDVSHSGASGSSSDVETDDAALQRWKPQPPTLSRGRNEESWRSFHAWMLSPLPELVGQELERMRSASER
jgi:hypothetical protein